MRFLGNDAFVGVAFLVALTSPAASQRVCQFNDTNCFNSRMHSQREQTLRRLQADNQSRQDGKVRNQRNSGWEQFRYEQLYKRGDPKSGCDVKPIISGDETRVVPAC